VTLVFTQFMTLGLLALSSGGGALLGYAVRARQNRLPRQRDADAEASVELVSERKQRAGTLMPPANHAQGKSPWLGP
jgi:hypothetical protein